MGGRPSPRSVAVERQAGHGEPRDELAHVRPDPLVDGRVVAGNRVGRITVQGQITEFDIPSPTGSPTNVAVGPDGNVWYTKGAALGRVTPAGQITEFPLPANARGVGLTAGSDRQPPARLVNRLWYADGSGNKIAYLEFE